MKKETIPLIILLLLSLSIFVSSQNAPGLPTDDGDYQKIKNVTDKIPIGDDGNVNWTKLRLNQTKSKAEQRIDEINSWLNENAFWLSLVFGLVPSLSWLFAVNLYLWLLFFLAIVINTPKEIGGQDSSAVNKLRIMGFALFAILVVTGAIRNLSKGIVHLLDLFINVILPTAFWAMVIATIVLAIIMYFFGPAIIAGVARLYALLAKANFIKKILKISSFDEVKEDQEILHATVEGLKEASAPV